MERTLSLITSLTALAAGFRSAPVLRRYRGSSVLPATDKAAEDCRSPGHCREDADSAAEACRRFWQVFPPKSAQDAAPH